MNELGPFLSWHRKLCPECTDTHACAEYLEIVVEFTVPRRIPVGSTAPHTTLSIREGNKIVPNPPTDKDR